MCGIAGIHLRTDTTKLNLDAILDSMLRHIEPRGGDATGYLALNEEGVTEWQRAACDVPDFIKYRRAVPKGTRTILCHTRWATQGLAAFMENNHPIRRGSFYVIHNGHVSNDRELFKLAGREAFAQVDSEAIAAFLAHHGSLDKGDKVMEEIEGAAAIAAVDEQNPDQLLLARGYSSPLNVLVTDKVVMWGSTESTVRKTYRSHVGKLPKRQKIESLPEGVMLLVTKAGVERRKFSPYAAPTYTYNANSYSHTWRREAWPWEAESAAASACEITPTQKLDPVHAETWWDEDEDEDGHGMEWSASDVLDATKETECDECGGVVPIMDIIRVPEPDSDFQWKLCEDCLNLWEQLDEKEYDRANQASLSLVVREEDAK